MKKVLILCCATIAIALVATSVPLNTMATSAVALAARQTCSLRFSSELPIDWLQKVYVEPHISPIEPLIHYDINEQEKWVGTSLLGLFSARAEFRTGYGCTLIHEQPLIKLTPLEKRKSQFIPIASSALKTHFKPGKLSTALAQAFHEPTEDSPRQTSAIVVLHQGELVAERYADDINQGTPLPGFSMAKSMTATLMGLLVQHKGLDIMSPIQRSGRLTEAGVTYDQLLRMISGINVLENGSGYDANSIMLTQTHDSARFAINQGLANQPGETYAYTGAGPVILASLFNRLAAENTPDAFKFIDQHLLAPLALNSVVLEVDGTGTFLGSSFMLASALDWAKLGQLYLQLGRWQGRQILPTGWSDYVSQVTPQSAGKEYGAGFWTARNGGRDAKIPHLPRLPSDAYYMHGMMNQAVYILPSHSLVIVRLGATKSYIHSGELQLVADVIAAMKQ